MRNKITGGRISYGQYRLADVMLFLLIMCVCEVINIFAVKYWFQGMMFTISVTLLVTLIVLVRWNWLGIIFPIVGGLMYCWMNGATAQSFAIYAIGNVFICLSWLLFLVVPKEKVTSSWLLTILYAIFGFAFMLLGRSVVAVCFGENFGSVFIGMLTSEVLNFAFAIIGLLIIRMCGNVFTDQKVYLMKTTEERDNVRPAEEYHWNGYTELNEDDLRALAAMDEYDRALNFNSRSLNRLKQNDGHELKTSEAINAEEESVSEIDELTKLDGK